MLLSLSSTIESDRSAYYHALNRAQRNLEVTDWIRYFLQIVLDSQLQAERMITFTPYKDMSITKTSKATATRDLQQLLTSGVISLHGTAAGRSTSYQINPERFPE